MLALRHPASGIRHPPFFCSAIVKRPTTLNASSSTLCWTPPGSIGR